MPAKLKRAGNSAVHAKLVKPQRTDLADKALMKLPKPIRDYLREEALANYNLRTLPRLVKTHGAERILAMLKANEAKETLRTYGPDHPQANRA